VISNNTPTVRVLVCGARKDFSWHEDFSRLAQEIAQWLVDDAEPHLETAINRDGGKQSGVVRLGGVRKRFDVSKEIQTLASSIEQSITPKPLTLHELLLM
jgi:predicted metal-dependent phosphotriesterase family hydrolase